MRVCARVCVCLSITKERDRQTKRETARLEQVEKPLIFQTVASHKTGVDSEVTRRRSGYRLIDPNLL